MPRIDITRLRKERGMSQSELAQLLQITQSFLSAIENGKSPLPPEKEARIMDLFGLNSLDGYILDENPHTSESQAKSIDEMSESDLFNRLMSRFHEQAHQKDLSAEHHQGHHSRITALEEANAKLLERIDSLLERNDRLASSNDALRKEIDSLRNELFRLKSSLTPTL